MPSSAASASGTASRASAPWSFHARNTTLSEERKNSSDAGKGGKMSIKPISAESLYKSISQLIKCIYQDPDLIMSHRQLYLISEHDAFLLFCFYVPAGSDSLQICK